MIFPLIHKAGKNDFATKEKRPGREVERNNGSFLADTIK